MKNKLGIGVALGFIFSRSRNSCYGRSPLAPSTTGGHSFPMSTRTDSHLPNAADQRRPHREHRQRAFRSERGYFSHLSDEQGIFGKITSSSRSTKTAIPEGQKEKAPRTVHSSQISPRATHRDNGYFYESEEKEHRRRDRVAPEKYRSKEVHLQSAIEGDLEVEVADKYAGSMHLSSEGLRDGIAAANVLCTYYSILIHRKGRVEGIKPISNILVYPVGESVYTDYWGALKFTQNGSGALLDESNYFTGQKVSSKEEIIKKGYLSDIGFYQAKDIPEAEMNSNYITAKMLIQEISNETKKDIDVLHREKVGLEFISGLQEYYQKEQEQIKNEKSCLTVCICSNNSCSGPCKSIKCVEPMYLI